MANALEGILVVSLEQAVAAPLATSRLADAGARVVKLERAEGDFARGYDTYAKGHSSYFVWLNRNKESCRVDLRDPKDMALVRAMLAKANVFVQKISVQARPRGSELAPPRCARRFRGSPPVTSAASRPILHTRSARAMIC